MWQAEQIMSETRLANILHPRNLYHRGDFEKVAFNPSGNDDVEQDGICK